MNLYLIPIWKHGSISIPPLTQPVDLDYIVSISPVDTWMPDSFAVGEPEASFLIFLKMGSPIKIIYEAGSTYWYKEDGFPPYVLKGINLERDNLIKAWEQKSSNRIPDWKKVEIDTGAHVIPIDDFQRGRHEGIKNCYDYIYNHITY